MSKITINIENAINTEEYAVLLICEKTGIHYVFQVGGGMLPRYVAEEGFVISLLPIDFNDGVFECADLDPDAGKEYRRLAFANALDDHFVFEMDCIMPRIRVDYHRIGLLTEGWWPVCVSGNFPDSRQELNHNGFIHNGD